MKKSILFLTLLSSVAATALRGGLINGVTPQQTFNHAVNQGYCSLYILSNSPTISSDDRIYVMAPTDYRLVLPVASWGNSPAAEQNFLRGIYSDIQTAFARLSPVDQTSYRNNDLPRVGQDFLNALRMQWKDGTLTAPINGGPSLQDDVVALFKNMGVTLSA